jgi:hypothetical protein
LDVNINWIAIEAIGSILAAFATTAAVLLALYESGVIFNERISIFFGLNFTVVNSIGLNEEVFEVKVTNKGKRPIYIQSFGFSFGKNIDNLMYINPEYGTIPESIPPGKNSVYCNKRKSLIKGVKELTEKNKGIKNRKVKVFVVTELKSYRAKTKYRIKDIINSEQ